VLHGHGRRRRRRELGFFDEDDEVAFGRPFSFWGPSRPGLPWSGSVRGGFFFFVTSPWRLVV
jgi:hypothetical protein